MKLAYIYMVKIVSRDWYGKVSIERLDVLIICFVVILIFCI